jgi:hypothetical protein
MPKKTSQLQVGLLGPKVPLIFSDGTAIYNKLKKRYIAHKIGYFILAPSGAGKTHFIKKQKGADWIDGDQLWMVTKAHPKNEWWKESIEKINEIDQRCDVITQEAKNLGFWIMGASNYWLRPDAIVLPRWATHKKYIKMREENEYDGGAKSDTLSQVVAHRRWISKWKKSGVPRFLSVSEAVAYLKNKKMK